MVNICLSLVAVRVILEDWSYTQVQCVTTKVIQLTMQAVNSKFRMASNVPLIRVKKAVVAATVENIPMVDGDAVSQRKEIYSVIGRWGELINRIGGVDAVETISILQVMYLFISSV